MRVAMAPECHRRPQQMLQVGRIGHTVEVGADLGVRGPVEGGRMVRHDDHHLAGFPGPGDLSLKPFHLGDTQVSRSPLGSTGSCMGTDKRTIELPIHTKS
jgi:hypothetical protein